MGELGRDLLNSMKFSASKVSGMVASWKCWWKLGNFFEREA